MHLFLLLNSDEAACSAWAWVGNALKKASAIVKIKLHALKVSLIRILKLFDLVYYLKVFSILLAVLLALCRGC